MKLGFGLGSMATAAATRLVLTGVAGFLVFSACGRLKDDSTRKEPRLGPAPAAAPAPAVDTHPAPADHAAAPADTAAPANTAAPGEPASLQADTSAPADTAASIDRPPYPPDSTESDPER